MANAPLTEEEKKNGIVGTPTSTQQVGQPTPIDTTLPTTPAPGEAPVSQSAPAPEVKPVKYDVNKETDTVAGQLNSLTAQSSPYIQQAREGAKRQANSRGLINSSIAAGSGEAAAINAAMPIAQQDASTYSQQRLQNQQAENTFLQNRQNTNLNKELDSFNNLLGMESEAFSTKLKTDADKFLNDTKFNDEIKLQYVQQINQIMRDTQQQITDIGLSSATAPQQAEAIKLAEQNRDAMIGVYQDLLGQSVDWDWGTDFTPDNQPTPGTTPGAGLPATPAPIIPARAGSANSTWTGACYKAEHTGQCAMESGNRVI